LSRDNLFFFKSALAIYAGVFFFISRNILLLLLLNNKCKLVKKKIVDILKIVIPLLLGCIIFWLVYRDIDIDQLKEALSGGISYTLIGASTVVALLSHIARAIRWQMLLKPLGSKISIAELTNTIFVNYGVNILLPRIGEFTRCGMVAKRDNISFTQVIGTLVSERMTDVATVCLIIIAAFALQMSIFFDFFATHPTILPKILDILSSPWFYLIIIGSLLSIYGVVKNFSHIHLVSRTKKAIRNIWEGFYSISRIPSFGWYTFWSITIWALYFVQLHFMVMAFELTNQLSLVITFVVFAMTCIAGIVPVQGGIGAWHFATITTLVYYGIGPVEAGAFALVAHAINTALFAIFGAYGFFAESRKVSIKSVRKHL